MKYQPHNGEESQRPCEDRYKIIKEFATLFNRPFSVLDIGANYGWFGQRLVEDFPNCVYVGVDNKTIDPHPRIWHINRHLPANMLADLSRSESFDIVLGLSVLHHFVDWNVAYNAMIRLGNYSFFEIPGEGESKALAKGDHDGIRRIFGKLTPIAMFPSHLQDIERPMYLIAGMPFISEQTLDAAYRGAPGYGQVKIFSDFDECKVEIDRRPIIEEVEVRDYIPGMNAHNYTMLSGKSVKLPGWEEHPDPRPWNYIVGDGVQAIDLFDKKEFKKAREEGK